MSTKTYQYFILAQSLLAISSPAFAEGAFDGANLQAGVGFESLNSDWKTVGVYGGHSMDAGEHGAAGNLSFGYSQGFSNKFNIATSVFYHLGSERAGSIQPDDLALIKIKNLWGISLEPGYYISDDTLAYLKLGYAQASSNLKIYGGGTESFGTSRGFLYGAGLKHSITKDFFLGVEAYQINLGNAPGSVSNPLGFVNETHTNTPTVTYGGVSLGYNIGGTSSNQTADPDAGTGHTFDGLNLQLGAGVAGINNYYYNPGALNAWKMGKESTVASASVGYSKAVSSRLNLAANIFYDFGSRTTEMYSIKWVTKNIWGLSIEPGYYFSNDTLGYLKVGYAKSSTKAEGLFDFGSTNGVLYGLGMKKMLTDNIYVGAEAYQINFDKSVEASSSLENKTSLMYGDVLIGYKF